MIMSSIMLCLFEMIVVYIRWLISNSSLLKIFGSKALMVGVFIAF